MKKILLLLLSLLLFFTLSAQVKIKERIEVNPIKDSRFQKNQIETQSEGYKPCGPLYNNGGENHYWQTVWAGYYGSLDPTQQLFYLQDDFRYYFVNADNTYDIEIIEGIEYCNFRKLVPIENELNMYEWVDLDTTFLGRMPGDSLVGNGGIMIFNEVPTYSNQYYMIQFHYIQDTYASVTLKITSSRNVTKYFHTLIVKRKFHYPENLLTFKIANYEEFDLYFVPTPVDCISDPFEFSRGGGLPDYVRFNVELVTVDSLYGILKRYNEGPFGEEFGFAFSELTAEELSECYFQAIGIFETGMPEIIVRISTSGLLISPLELKFNVRPNSCPPIKVEFDPPVIDPGDTSLITLSKRLLESDEYYPFEPGFDKDNIEYTPFGDDQMYSIFNAFNNPLEDYGDILWLENNEKADFFGYVNDSLAFIADSSIEGNGLKVQIEAEAFIIASSGGSRAVFLEDKEKKELVSLSKSNNNTLTFNSTISKTYFGGGELIIGKGIEIMLGETKYLGLKKKEEYNEVTYKIAEIPTDYGDIPEFPPNADGWTWIKDKDVWGERPVDVSTEGTSQIFYDWLYATVSTSGVTKPVMHDLPDGMIRIVGRYWEEIKENKLNLFSLATNEREADTIEVKVIKPNKLGDSDNQITGPTYTDAIDKEYNLDSLIIKTAGELGVLPQVIKSIMNTESNLKPAYRYEPFDDLTKIQNPDSKHNPKFDSTHIYWIKSETDEGTPGIPVHNNVRDAKQKVIDYPGYVTAWDYYKRNESFYSRTVYNRQNNQWKNYRNKWRNYFDKLDLDEDAVKDSIKILADTSYITFLKDSIGGKGFVGTVAQTRIAASYGVMQLTYYSKIGGEILGIYDYPDNDDEFLPEYLNIPPLNVEWGSKHLLGKIRSKDVLGSLAYLKEDTWPEAKGLELTYWKGLKIYNGDEEYPNKVFSNVHKYLPE